MKAHVLALSLLPIVIAIGGYAAINKTSAVSSGAGPATGGFSDQERAQFAELDPIDAHSHIYESNKIYFAMLQRLHLHVLDIMVADDRGLPERRDLAKESKDVFDVVRNSEGHVSACSTFDAHRFNDADFDAVAIRRVNQSFAQGAIAVKIWKNVGMEIKDSKGNYILPDNPALEPIYKDIAAHHKTLIAHIADPDTAFEAPNPASPDYSYFIQHPEWYMYKIPHSPSKQQILLARDHVLEANPNLRVVGAHLGSMEGDFGEVAQHLDRYPNFAVDLAARMPYLMLQPRAKIITFITKYQDRLIYGTDDSLFPQADVQKMVNGAEASYARDWRFLATSDTVEFRGQKIQGLNLPKPILRKIYHENAVHWFPGILSK